MSRATQATGRSDRGPRRETCSRRSSGASRRLRRTGAIAACILGLAALPACVGGGTRLAQLVEPAGLPPSVEIASTPFHPQKDPGRCGPAAVATVLGAAGRDASPQALSRELFLPGREGSLPPELVAAIRARGLVPYVLTQAADALLAELAAGRPVLVLQRQGVGPWPAWHYAVAIGYDAARDVVTLRSGVQPRLQLRAEVFDATWARADRWALVALSPGTLPARPDLARYLEAAAGFEATGQLREARRAYEAAVSHWPAEPLPRLALANVDAADNDWNAAERGYAVALQLQPGLAAALNNRAEALVRLGCPHAALRLLESGVVAVAADDALRPVLTRTAAAAAAAARLVESDAPAPCAGLH